MGLVLRAYAAIVQILGQKHTFRLSGVGLIVLLLIGRPVTFVSAQPPGVVIQVPPGGTPVGQPGPQPGQPPANAGGGAADGAAKEGEANGEKSADGKEEKKEEDDKSTIKRPTEPPRVPDPREFDVKLDKNQRVSFNFHGQMWPDVLQWLASLGGNSLDWQELPNDYIHVASNRDLTLSETRDLFNRLLFDRGFTIVAQGNLLIVLKLDKLDPSLIQRVDDESELLDLSPHDVAKITFQLPDELKADKAAEDVKPLLSQYSKIQPLMATNRLLVIDLVANLRDVSQIVNAEHSAATSRIVPQEFPLRYARAEEVADQVMILLGLDPSSRRTPQELQVEQQRLQLFAQMQQQGKDVTKYMRGDNAPVVFLAVNHRNNSVIANAPAKELAIIQQAVELLDVPSGMLSGAQPAALTMKRYTLVTLKPQSIVTAMQDIGDLDPRSQLQIDTEAKTVFAHATARDHQTIQAMIDQLDGSGRQFDVIWLRRLPADAVATTIVNLMVGKEEKDDNNNRRGYFSFYGPSFNNDDDQQPNKGFRVDADAQNNRLLLWANEAELQEIRKLLVKLGEIPGESGNPNTMRSIHLGDEATARRVIEQLKAAWPSTSRNPLQVAPGTESRNVKPRLRDDPPPKDTEAPTPAVAPIQATSYATESIASTTTALAWAPPVPAVDAVDTDEGADVSSDELLAPVHISIGPDGRLLLRSFDTRALDRAEEILERIAPPKKNFEVFYLRHASASLVTLNLEEYFEEEAKTGSSAEDAYWAGWYGYGYSGGNDDSDSVTSLSQRKPLRFIYDFDTNSILVSNASPEQLATIRSLIEIYDQPISEDSISARRFQMFRIQHAQATTVAATLKEVYRDLLSSKDKVFERNGNEKEQTSQSTNYYRVYGSVDDNEKKPTKVKASFAGALSVGVDETSNTIIVSAQEEWMESIASMIQFLDTQAAPYRDSVQVVNTSVSGQSLQAALAKLMGSEASKVQLKSPQEPTPESPSTPEKSEAAGEGNATSN